MKLRAFASLFLLPVAVLAGEREIAEWILREGGMVMVNGGEPITSLADLPAGQWHITGVDLYGTPTVPRDMKRLSELTELRQLYVSSKTYSPSSDTKGEFGDGSFEFLAKLPKLETFHVSLHFLPTIDITNDGWKHMAGHTQLKDLRLSLTTITKPEILAPFVNLESLDLSQAYITDTTMKAVAGMTKLKRLIWPGRW